MSAPRSAHTPAPAATQAAAHAARPTAAGRHAASTVLPAAALAVLRVMSALVLMQHGTQKMMGFPANPARPWGGAPEAFSRSWIAGVLELVGGTLLLLGLFTRPVAFVLSGLMAFAYFLVHAPQNFYPIVNRGEPAVLLCFVFLYFAAAGGGRFSADALLRRRGEDVG